MQILVGGHNNIYTYTFTVAGTVGTLVISGVEGFDLTDKSLANIYDVTTTGNIPSNRVTVVLSRVAGQPVWTYTIPNLPAGTATGDTLNITLNVPDCYFSLPNQQYQSSKV